MRSPPFKALDFRRLKPSVMRLEAERFKARVEVRRSVRDFSPEPVPLDVLNTCIEAACTAPSGANKQPWTYVVVTASDLKVSIREAAEAEERAFYQERAPQSWLDDLAQFGTGPQKPYLETAPALVVVFAQRGTSEAKHYYVTESVGLSVGFFLAACAHAGLATLTHTPSPMGFLTEVLGRPPSERPFVLIPVGYPAEGCTVPNIERKQPSEMAVWRTE